MTEDTDPGRGTDAATDRDPTVYDHLRPATGSDGSPEVAPGVYRVVGTDGTVTLLRVGDADGRRVHTGEVATVDRDDLAGFEPADNPDGNRSPAAALAGAAEGVVWQARSFGQGLAARPLASLGAAVLLVAGYGGDRFVPGPDLAFTAAYVLGVAALVYLGTRGG